MEIYKEIQTPALKEFSQLLNEQASKSPKLEEGKIYTAKVVKLTKQYCFLHIPGLKSEPVLDLREIQTMGMLDSVKVDSTIDVFLERLEDKNSEVLVSLSKAKKIAGWNTLLKKFDNNELTTVKCVSRVKGGIITEDIETGTLMFMPGSQVSDKPTSDISKIFGEVFKVAIIKADRERGNLCCSRRQVLSSGKKESKSLIIAKYKIGDIIKDAECKSLSSFGAFFTIENGALDVLTHLMELSYSRIDSPSDVLTVGDKKDLLVISIDETKGQIGTSIRQLMPDPFKDISKYKLNTPYKVCIVKITDFGCFVELQKGLTALLHSSNLSWTKKNPSPKRMFAVGQSIMVHITEIDIEKKRIAVDYRITTENPYNVFSKKYKINDICKVTVSSINEYAIYASVDGVDDIKVFLHHHDLSHQKNTEELLKNYKEGQKIEVKVVEFNPEQSKIRVSLKALTASPWEFFNSKGKKIKDTLTCKVLSVDPKKGLMVRPVGSENLELMIKKNNLSISASDCRPSRWTGGELLDAAILELDVESKKCTLSIKLLEQMANDQALKMGNDPLSGRQLPFSSLSNMFKKEEKKKTKEE